MYVLLAVWLCTGAHALNAHANVAGGELPSADTCTSDAYLQRWLFAREWDVNLTYGCIVKHAGWRAHVMPHGFIDEVRCQVVMPATQSQLGSHASYRRSIGREADLCSCASVAACACVQEWIQGPLQTEKIFLQGTDSTGRALAIIRVAGHVADKKALKNMKLFVCYVMNAMVRPLSP